MTSRQSQLKVWVQDWTPALQVRLVTALSEQLSVPIRISIKEWNWDRIHAELLKGLEDGSAPDVIEIGSTWTSRLAPEGALLNVTDFATGTLNAASLFFPRLLNSCRQAEHLDQYYAVPLVTDLRVLFYNVEALQGYPSRHPGAFKSWGAFEAMCLALKDVLPNRVFAWPLRHADAFHDCLPWVWAAGGDIISSSREILVDSEPTQRAFQRLARLVLNDCAPVSPDHMVDTKDGIRSRFSEGQVGIMTGALWMLHALSQRANIKAALHPPDVYPATFSGGSNLAIVRRHGDDERDERYILAKSFVQLMTTVPHQITFAREVGKLPSNILAWKEMKRQNQDERIAGVLEVFDDALCHTVDRSMPSLPNLAQIEEDLKSSVEAIWERIGEIKRNAPGEAPSALEAACNDVIWQELTAARRRIERFLAGDTVLFTATEVKRIGITPPGRFDVWLEQTVAAPTEGRIVDGNIYVAGRGRIEKKIGPLPFSVLLALVDAPGRALSESQLLQQFWGYTSGSDGNRFKQITAIHDRLVQLSSLLQKSIAAPPATLEELRQSLAQLGGPVTLPATASPGDRLQREIQRRLEECQVELVHVVDQSRFKHAQDSLRQVYRALDGALDQIRGEPVITHLERGNYDLKLNPRLSICIVTP